ncbi:methyltransferase-like protein 27 [Nematostella vectensis]|uniref:methyltransferase-like protein 27 n=1 Tax=Nematostella vectensis TaxID=45351 RepID=UPI0013900919|nr:methyltransferase-like protein 27 [Nematostella vectensis]XP_048583526.1 methyltransferase-like protein 27 [Nematostella vectensis]
MATAPEYHYRKLLTENSSPDAVKKVYDDWALDYEKDIAIRGFDSHHTYARILDSTLATLFPGNHQSLHILDAGAGTGLMGVSFKRLGYTIIDALDFSQEMLNCAKEKNVYRRLICAPIGEGKHSDISQDNYDVLICTGTLSSPNVRASGLDELIHYVKPGGVICFTLHLHLYDNRESEYRKRIDELEREGKWSLYSKHVTDYNKYIPARAKCYLLTYRVL